MDYGSIDLKSGEVYLVDYQNSDVIFPTGCKKADGSMLYRLSEVEPDLMSFEESHIQVISFTAGTDYIQAEVFVSDVNNLIKEFQFLIGRTEQEVRQMTGSWQTETTYQFTNLQPDTSYCVLVKLKMTDGTEKNSNVYKVNTASTAI